MRERLDNAISKAQRFLLSRQTAEGYFYSELYMDLALEADTIFMLRFLGIKDETLERKLINFILDRQLEGGGWPIYPGGPPDLNPTLKCYLALKLKGYKQDDPVMVRARKIILDLGGIERSNSYNRFYLAMFGLGEWDAVPAIPPEIILFPSWFAFNIYELSAWSRTIIIPLSIVWAFKPIRLLEKNLNIDELYKNGRRIKNLGLKWDKTVFSWRNFFLLFDCAVKSLYKFRIRPLRRIAVKKATSWMIERLGKSAGLGAIFPSMVNCIFALGCLGYENDHPLMKSCVEEIKKLVIDHGDKSEMQPCVSPVWDTALAVYSLAISGLPQNHEVLIKAGRWLLSKQVIEYGDWKVKAKDAEPGGWYFEFENEFYPDVDDTAQVLLALMHIDMGEDEPKKKKLAFERGLDWMLKMQSSDGGFSSFDKDNNKQFLTKIPFADHNAMLDPTCSDITGRICELLSRLGYNCDEPRLKNAINFLKAHQLPDGTWYGRWGINYIYGTFLACRGLSFSNRKLYKYELDLASKWIRSAQNRDGGWGETALTYEDPSQKGKGPSAASQTAWALLALFACGDYDSNEVKRGIEFLIETQQEDGGWREFDFTGTGFPKVCYLRYELYSVYFPLIAIAEWVRFPKCQVSSSSSRSGSIRNGPQCTDAI
ncbi:MAG: squalene--hopene cyclase [Candidatus Omnitrophota bacterium]